MYIALAVVLLAIMILAHVIICIKLAYRQCAEAIKVILELQLEAIDQQDFNRANRLAWDIFAVDTEQHYRDLVIFRNPWDRYSVEVRLKLGQE